MTVHDKTNKVSHPHFTLSRSNSNSRNTSTNIHNNRNRRHMMTTMYS